MLTTKERAKDARLRKHFGITLADYMVIYNEQGGCCGICKRHSSNFKNSLAVDHNHKSGLVRGLLCMHCNRALGKWLDNDENVANASQYIGTPPAYIALKRYHFTAPGRVGTKVREKLLAKSKRKSNGNK